MIKHKARANVLAFKMSETSVQNAENRCPIRKSGSMQGMKLPYQTRKTGVRYGSQGSYRA